ncbi:hypothetical protein G3T20_05460 [Bordetella hinzii]|uniref:hypothetical protein n=1 Tax=Bordetella hinzii TaxID=103855 RepID=UPI0013EFF451|nr:hypothetical protein [Bordetella hinzii]QII84198.1 hypothetical protein G3T20_05460 [Bordetella hinzii]
MKAPRAVRPLNPWKHNVLPPAAQELLVQAAAVDAGNHVSHERAKAVNHAIAKVQKQYPQHFRRDAGLFYSEALKP